MKISAILCDAGMAANVGGTVHVTTRTFEMPQELAEYIRDHDGQYSHVSLAVDMSDEAKP